MREHGLGIFLVVTVSQLNLWAVTCAKIIKVFQSETLANGRPGCECWGFNLFTAEKRYIVTSIYIKTLL